MAKNFYFAWVDQDTDFDPAVHNVEDEDVFAHQYSWEEGGFAGLQLTIRNPRIGLLNAGRKVWAYYAFNKAEEGNPEDIVPVFFGRLVGLPDNIFDTLVTLSFVARPSNFVAQKLAVANTLKVLPYWDPIFIQPDSWEDPDTVLEGRSALWHIDPVTHLVSISDILIAEDGIIDLPASQMFYESMQCTLQAVPLRSVFVQATIPWTQTATGTVDLTAKILKAFSGDSVEGFRSLITSFTLEGLSGAWPKDGAGIGSGWQVSSGSLTDVTYGTVPTIKIPIAYDAGQLPALGQGSIIFPEKTTGTIWGGVEGSGYNFDYQLVGVALGYGAPVLTATYTASREFAQIVTFTLYTDQQAIVTEADEDETQTISLSANKVSDPTFNSSIPIGNVKSRDYVHTPRGMRSIEHLLLVARANLIARSRTVRITFDTDLETCLQYTGRKSGIVHDPRLPGGEALGKVVSIAHSLDGDSGTPIGTITLACAIGYGGAYTIVPGTPDWIDEGYIDREYQQYVNEIVVTDTSDIQWTVPPWSQFDDGLDFIAGLTPDNVILSLFVINGESVQRSAIMGASAGENTDQAAVSAAMQLVPTQVSLQLKPMEGGPFVQEVPISVSDLIIPKQIDLEAPSV